MAEKAPFLLLSLGCCLITMHGPHADGTVVPFSDLPLRARLSNAAISYVAYLGQMIWPTRLAALYPHPFEAQPALAGCAAALLLVITICAWRLRKTHPFLLIGWLWYLGSLVPVLGLVQVGPQARADRFVYLPQIGVFVGLVWSLSGIDWLRQRVKLLASAAIAIIAALVFLTSRQVEFWTNGATLFEHAVAVTRDNARAYQNAGLARARLGDDAMARAHFRAALRLSPLSAETWNNLGSACVRLGGHGAEAIECFRHAIAIEPAFVEARYNLGAVHERAGAIDQAAEQLRAAIDIRPGFAQAHYRLGKLLERQGHQREAMEHLQRADALQSGGQ
jgi:tetratricopeptide (TPR) repeat protein